MQRQTINPRGGRASVLPSLRGKVVHMATATRAKAPVVEAEAVESAGEEVVPEVLANLEDAQAQARALRAAQASKKRTVRAGRRVKVEIDADMPWPEMDFEALFPSSYFAVIDKQGETLDDTEFHIDEDKLVGLAFAAPNAPIGGSVLYVVKAIQPDGRIIQLPFEDQINNTAAGDREDAIGLRKYERRGITLLWDWNEFLPIYCAHINCWARAMVPGLVEKYPAHRGAVNSGFCSLRHQARTLPNMFDEAGNIRQGLMSQGVTTTRMWKV